MRDDGVVILKNEVTQGSGMAERAKGARTRRRLVIGNVAVLQTFHHKI